MSKLLKHFSASMLTVMFLFFAASAVSSCSSDDENDKVIEQSVVLSAQSVTLEIGDRYIVDATFTPDVKPTPTHRWVSSAPAVAGIIMSDDQSATITAKEEGNTTISISSSEGSVKASLNVTVIKPVVIDDGILKILAIGNSFSEDAIENYLYELASAEDVKIVIGNLYIGGSSLEQHWNNAKSNTAAYDYRKIAQDGTKTNTSSTTIENGVLDENWDYISFQQVSNNSGQYETFVTPLPALIEYVKKRSTNSTAKYLLHQTWAYAKNSTHSAFPNYNSDQEVMYKAIVEAVRKAQTTFGLDLVIPSGTAIQNGRNTLIGDNFTRDGYHLNSMGRYTAACTWFEALTGINVIGNPFKPEALSNLEAEIAQNAARVAVLNPDKVTPLPDYAPGEVEPLEAAVLVNFGQHKEPKWNIIGHLEGASVENLKDENDKFTNISLTVTQRFNGINSAGEKGTTTDFNMPDNVSNQSYFGNSKGVWDGMEIKQSQIKFVGLNPTATYNLCFFASRGGVGDNRETQYVVAGDNSKTAYLQTSNNKADITCADGIRPNTIGEITVTVSAGPKNDNGSGFYFLGAMRLTQGK